MAEVSISVEEKLSRRAHELVAFFNNDRIRKNVNNIIAQVLTPYVPMRTGTLRDSVTVYPDRVTWGEYIAVDYARYQYNGEVYGPNIPGLIFGAGGFRSPDVKFPTGRKLGAEGDATLRPKFVINRRGTRRANRRDPSFQWHFGYTTPGTTSEWLKMYSGDVKSEANRKITRYLKQAWKQRGVNV